MTLEIRCEPAQCSTLKTIRYFQMTNADDRSSKGWHDSVSDVRWATNSIIVCRWVDNYSQSTLSTPPRISRTEDTCSSNRQPKSRNNSADNKGRRGCRLPTPLWTLPVGLDIKSNPHAWHTDRWMPIFKHCFYELCHEFKNYYHIFIDGSKEGNIVAAAVVHRDNTKCVR